MTIGIWVLGDQLNLQQAALAGADPSTARVLLLESSSVLERRAYHAQKLVPVSYTHLTLPTNREV